MKYRILTPEEMEVYKIGYKVGLRELFIIDQKWESKTEHRIYRKGYLAGCQDRRRKNIIIFPQNDLGKEINKPKETHCEEPVVSQIEKTDAPAPENKFVSMTDNDEIRAELESPDSAISIFLDTGTGYDELTISEREFVDRTDVREKCAWHKQLQSSVRWFKKFTPPTEEEVLEYAREQNSMAGVGGFACSDEDALNFYDYYTGIGWHIPNSANTPMQEWKPFLRKWMRNPGRNMIVSKKIDINYGQYEYLRPQMNKWIAYKKSRDEEYKTEQSLLSCVKKMHELSGGNVLLADAIIEQSIANNYVGLFPLKQKDNPMKRPLTAKEIKDLEYEEKKAALLAEIEKRQQQ